MRHSRARSRLHGPFTAVADRSWRCLADVRRTPDRDPRWRRGLAVHRARADERARLADPVRHHRLPDGLAARRQGREQPQPGRRRADRGARAARLVRLLRQRLPAAARLLRRAAPPRRRALPDDGVGLHAAEHDAVFRAGRRCLDGLAAVVPAQSVTTRHRRPDARRSGTTWSWPWRRSSMRPKGCST